MNIQYATPILSDNPEVIRVVPPHSFRRPIPNFVSGFFSRVGKLPFNQPLAFLTPAWCLPQPVCGGGRFFLFFASLLRYLFTFFLPNPSLPRYSLVTSPARYSVRLGTLSYA